MSEKQLETAYLHIRIPAKLKDEFSAICKERGISLSDGVRDFMSKEVRNFRRKN